MLHTGSIREVHQELVRNVIHISEYALRRWIKAGVLPAVYTGSKALIAYANVIKLLENGTDCA